MTLATGSRLGAYEILSALGAGGMGEVYRARDTKLGRDVALKILPATFANDPERLARFQREAHVLASLNHSHIAAIYGLEESGGLTALVLELVDGPTLADRIGQGPIPTDEALPIAKQIAEALEAAHEQGIIHRDLKPANIKVRPDGTVKVLDFGLAKALEPTHDGGPSASLANSPTITSPAIMTGVGVILGTAAYMSPEQAKGRPADKRSDVWAFGCVLYEMLTGGRAFDGADVAESLAAILRSEPDWSKLPADVPLVLRGMLARCLHKDVNQRIHDMADVRIWLDDLFTLQSPTVVVPTSRPGRGWVWVAGVLAIAAMTVAVLWFTAGGRSVLPVEIRADIATGPSREPMSFALSPDGRSIVYAATQGGRSQLWLRGLDGTMPRALPGTDLATWPGWSPDSQSICFFAGGYLKRLDLQASAPQNLAPATNGFGAAWTSDGTILFTPAPPQPVWQVNANGGSPTPLTKLSSELGGHTYPQVFPDGKHFIFFARERVKGQGIYIASRQDGSYQRLTDSDSAGTITSDGRMLFVRDGMLFAQSVDLTSRQLTGSPSRLAAGVSVEIGGGLGASAGNGVLAIRVGAAGTRQLAWFDREGRELRRYDATNMSSPELSPDERWVAAQTAATSSSVVSSGDLWTVELETGQARRLTFDGGSFPVWSPDGRKLAYVKRGAGTQLDVYERPVDASSAEHLLIQTSGGKVVYAFSPEGKSILYRETGEATKQDLFVAPLADPARRTPVASTPGNEMQGQFSPDGRWIAFASDSTGRYEVFVAPFPDRGGKWQVSSSGGNQPRWRADGSELFFLSDDGVLMAAPVAFDAKTASFQASAPKPLFRTSISGVVAAKQEYTVSRDGQRFLMVTRGEASTQPITLILNWKP